MWQRLSIGPWHDLNINVHGFNGSRFNGSGLPAGWQAGFTENLNSPTSKANRSTYRPFGSEPTAEGLSTGERKITLNLQTLTYNLRLKLPLCL